MRNNINRIEYNEVIIVPSMAIKIMDALNGHNIENSRIASFE